MVDQIEGPPAYTYFPAPPDRAPRTEEKNPRGGERHDGSGPAVQIGLESRSSHELMAGPSGRALTDNVRLSERQRAHD